MRIELLQNILLQQVSGRVRQFLKYAGSNTESIKIRY